ncbi:MAG TPA: phosphoglycerate dehydrogenase [Propionibacteriaceae bacterium]|nr:phosphoglycerate dehydrogenase [Propionibacteriaceae bacterium]
MKALLLENIHPIAVDTLRERGYEVDLRTGALGEDELISALEGVDLLGIRSGTHVTQRVIASAPQLATVGCFCIGTNQVDLTAAAHAGLPVFNAPFSNTRSVVELVMGEIIVMARRLTDKNRLMHGGVWDKSAAGAHEVRGRTLGIVGYGNIGSQLSVLAESFGMRVVFFDLADKLALGNAKRCETLEELLAISDTVTLHVDGRASNADFFGAEQFAQMKPRAMFLNLSRGFIVDEQALVENLESGHISGAALDVFQHEPRKAGDPFVSPLQNVPNVILTPHIGGSTQEAQEDIGRYVAAKLGDYVESGATGMSVNLPSVNTEAPQGVRVLHLHRNVPGVLARLNQRFADHGANITYQSLATKGEYGYVVTDLANLTGALADELASMPETVRVRVLEQR